MLDYKSIIIKRYALKMSYKELAEEFSASKSGINDFIRAFEKCEKLSYPLPCILQSAADVDAFQSGRYAEHNGRPKTLKKVA